MTSFQSTPRRHPAAIGRIPLGGGASGELAIGVAHQCYRPLRTLLCRGHGPVAEPVDRDRGAVSLEQVLWFVAAGVGVAVIAAILWNQIRETASTPIDTPSAP